MADKVPDSHVKLWAAALLADACKLPASSSHVTKYQQQNPEAVHANVKQQLLHDFMTSSKLDQHKLIQVHYTHSATIPTARVRVPGGTRSFW